jgi:glycosyltransferase involved in cell wall biosynthesis
VVREFAKNITTENDYCIGWFPIFTKKYFVELGRDELVRSSTLEFQGTSKGMIARHLQKLLFMFPQFRGALISINEWILLIKLLIRKKDVTFHKVKADDRVLLIDAFWADSKSVRRLKRFEQMDIDVFLFVHDLFPISNPEWFRENQVIQFKEAMCQALRMSSGILCSSQFVKSEILSMSHKIPMKHANVAIVKLACSYTNLESAQTQRSGIVILGTIEPRKNIPLILDWLEKYSPEESVLFIGRRGWESQHTIIRLEFLVASGRANWIEDASDLQVISYLARNRVGILASKAEGFGLPILEYAKFGLHVLAHDIPVFREIGAGGTLYFKSIDELQTAYLSTRKLPQPQPIQSEYSWMNFSKGVLANVDTVEC